RIAVLQRCELCDSQHGIVRRRSAIREALAMTDLSSSDPTSTRGITLFVFFLLAFALMWICFSTVAFVPIPAKSALGQGLILLWGFAAAIAALVVTSMTEGRTGVAALLRSVTRWNVSAKYYVLALLFMVALKLTAALIHRATVGAWPRFGSESLYLIPVA